MKKLISLLLAVMFVAVIAGSVFAGEGGIAYSRGPDARVSIKTYSYSHTAQDASGTLVAGSNRILGFTVSGSAASSGGLYDTTSTTNVHAGTGLITDAYCAAGTAVTIMFPMPYTWSNTLYVLTPTAGSVVAIFYE